MPFSSGLQSPAAAAAQTVPEASPLGDQIFLMGEVFYLLSHSPRHHGYSVLDIVTFIMTPIRLGQFRIYRSRSRPVGFVCWAFLERKKALAHASGAQELPIGDWRCGPEPWIMEFVAPFGHARRMSADIRRVIFPNAIFYAARPRANAPPRIVTWKGEQLMRAERESRRGGIA